MLGQEFNSPLEQVCTLLGVAEGLIGLQQPSGHTEKTNQTQ